MDYIEEDGSVVEEENSDEEGEDGEDSENHNHYGPFSVLKLQKMKEGMFFKRIYNPDHHQADYKF